MRLKPMDVIRGVRGAVVWRDGRQRELGRDPSLQDLCNEWGAEVQVLFGRSLPLSTLDHRVHTTFQVDDAAQSPGQLLFGVGRVRTARLVEVGSHDRARQARDRRRTTG